CFLSKKCSTGSVSDLRIHHGPFDPRPGSLTLPVLHLVAAPPRCGSVAHLPLETMLKALFRRMPMGENAVDILDNSSAFRAQRGEGLRWTRNDARKSYF
ncbi:MAG: hypothetical protein SF339_30140, partial [Blastocatellia bacterium]|nr:hypothetical protein [Blastocatellia bacterium]